MTTIVSYGGGTNSTAMLIGMVRASELPPHAILFADTGGEKPHTYDYVAEFSEWLVKWGYPPITTVKKGGRQETLEEECLRVKSLPSIAYGYKTCSHKFKIEPQDKWTNNDDTCRATWKDGGLVTKLIGFHVDEQRRAGIPSDKKFQYRYPLIQWGWGQEECVRVIQAVGFRLPGKSACFFCPNSKPSEVRQLAVDYPDLIKRALAMEANAELTHIKGLGRNFSWRDALSQVEMFPYDSAPDMPCGCYDGEAA